MHAGRLDGRVMQGSGWRSVLAVAATAWLGGCAVQIQNLEPARELAAESGPFGSVYTGWRVFQDRCAACHGTDAMGTAKGPDLLPKMREMGPRRFVSVVLTRYDWELAAAQAGSTGAARETLIDEVLQRKSTALPMPAWQGEPQVDAHIVDLYAYLVARAEGTQGPGRPAP
jgi:mono/diheme cytochrome c family protein